MDNNQNGIDAETRLIGVEDINWDSLGQNENTSFTDGGGTERPLRKINASHVPLPAFARSVCGGADNVADGMIHLSEMASSGNQNNESMTEDTSISIAASANMDEKMALLNLQKKNLGGHTLSLIFQEAIDQVFNESFLVRGFYNGTILINLNGNTISDTANIGALFLLQDCHCKIELKNGTLKHSLSYYAVQAERCPSIYLSNLNFIGTGGNGSCAFYGINSDGFASECLFNTDTPSRIQGIFADYQDRALNSHNTSENPHEGRFELSGSIQSHDTNENAHSQHQLDSDAHPNAFTKHNEDASAHAAAFSSHDSNTNAHAAAFGKYTALGVLGAIPDLPDGSDLNQVTSGNFFGYRDYTYSNVPTGANVEFFLENLKSGTGSRLIQRLTDRNDNTYIRHKWGKEWTSWMKIMREDSLMTLPPAISDSSNHQVNSWWVHSLLADKFANSLGDQGFQKFYNGTIIQWGYSTVSTSGTTLSFPTAFPNAVKGILAVSCNASGVPSSAVPVATGRISNAQFSLRATASCGAYWFAIGY